ncbi:SPFH domain-containing protein, partial [Streptomyces anulatus]|uniref:SPFH domain-containing protein n=1 Tax=Streptomyces anulatus TaxID=1892 RepID=UPI003440CC90
MERRAFRVNGFAVLVGLLVLAAVLAGAALAVAVEALAVAAALWGVIAVIVSTGFVVINPNEGKVVQFLGRYVGSVNDAGFHWVLPFTGKRRITLRVRNFETAKLKVNDADGNPVEIAAVVVYRVTDTAKAAFSVDDYEEYIAIQSEAAVRHLATSHPYDAHEENRTSLRDGTEVAAELTTELVD